MTKLYTRDTREQEMLESFILFTYKKAGLTQYLCSEIETYIDYRKETQENNMEDKRKKQNKNRIA